jgi:hypothetical protein
LLIDEGAKAYGNIVGQDTERETARGHAEAAGPARLRLVGLRQHLFQLSRQCARPCSAQAHARPIGQGLELARPRPEGRAQFIAGLPRGPIQLLPGHPAFLATESGTDSLEWLLQPRMNRSGRTRSQPELQQLAARIEEQRFDLPARAAQAKAFRGKIRQLVGLVQDHGIDPREQFAEAVFLEGQIRQQQMMIDDDQLSCERRTPCRKDMAA